MGTDTSIPHQTDNTEPAPALKVGDRVQHDDLRHGTVRDIVTGGIGDGVESTIRAAVLVRWDGDPGDTWEDEAQLTTADPEPILQVDDRVRHVDGRTGRVRDTHTDGSALVAFDTHPPRDAVWVRPWKLTVLETVSSIAEIPAIADELAREGAPAELPMAHRVADELRYLAGILDEHPELSFHHTKMPPPASVNVWLRDPAQVDEWAAVLGTQAEDTSGTGSMPTRQINHFGEYLKVYVYAFLPEPDPDEVAKALAYYRARPPEGSNGPDTGRCQGCGRSITRVNGVWQDDAFGDPVCPPNLAHQLEGHGQRAGEQA